ncbi:MAG: hypothetical protein MPL62_10300 [Alphaproteobacteria bacterium]|nr:hypothetical protein [Alphaproteobacteria bacterium]
MLRAVCLCDILSHDIPRSAICLRRLVSRRGAFGALPDGGLSRDNPPPTIHPATRHQRRRLTRLGLPKRRLA